MHTGSASPPRLDGKDRQQAVAHEFKDLAAVPGDRGDLAVEVAVEKIDQRLRRQPFGARREPAHV
jgi:hypothetical protein